MDSFHCLIAPYPSKKPSLEPSVPDVSFLMNPSTTNSYRSWKNNFSNEDKCENNQVSVMKKQVRFDNSSVPVKSSGQIQTEDNCSIQSGCPTPPLNKIFKNKQFQDVYMANIPNRNLDLSLIDIIPVSKKRDSGNTQSNSSEQVTLEEPEKLMHQRVPTTYKEFLEMQSCGVGYNKSKESDINKETCITDIFNYTSPKYSPRLECFTQRADKYKCDKQMNSNSLKQLDKINYTNAMTDRYRNPLNSNTTQSPPVIQDRVELFKGSHLPQEIKSREAEIDSNSHDQYSSDSCIEQIDPKKIGAQMNSEKCDNGVQTSIICPSDKIHCNNQNISSTESEKNNDPTVKDLLKIIHQQNEQLLILQKQVASILDCRDYPKLIEPRPQSISMTKDKCITNGEQRDVRSSGSTPRKGPLPKFSIDLMTSFEVSFRPQQNIHYRKHKDLILEEPKIQEITETESNDVDSNRVCGKKFAESSLHLQDPISVQENCPSPEPSINIDMKDYETSDEDEDDVTSDIGSTFYRNLMDHVNKIIQNAQKQTNNDSRSLKAEEWRDKTLSRVKDCTIKHLRKIGMKFSTIDEVSSSSCCTVNGNDTPEQISFAVKQLLMKYLPDDQLAKLTLGKNKNSRKQTQEKIILNSRAPEFSFNTVQFMKKYDLIANDGTNTPQKFTVPVSGIPSRMYKKPNQTNPKILDISSLKQQPKLL